MTETVESTAPGVTLRKKVILQSRDKILQNGFVRLTVDQLAADTGMSKKTLYSVFAGKHQVVEGVIDSFLSELKEGLDRVMSDDQIFTGKFQQIMILLGNGTKRVGKPFLDDLQRHMPEQWEKIQAFRRERILTVFSRLIDQGIREGSVRPDIQKDLFLTSYLAAVEAVITPTFLMSHPLSTREAIAGILQIFFQGALTPAASRKVRPIDTDGKTIQSREPLS